MKNFETCLWFNGQAEQAAEFYSSVFKTSVGGMTRYSEDAARASGNAVGAVMTVDMQIENLRVLGLNGGPHFKFTPSFSFFVCCSSKSEIEQKWKSLSSGGKVRMELNQYPWSEAYGWTADKFGVEWQLILNPVPRKISPAFLFVDELFGRGQEAIDFYLSIFPNSELESVARDQKTNSILHARFSLNGESFVLMEGAGKHGHKFNESFSLIVNCDTQAEIDRLWTTLTSDGGSESQCGWLKDKFGVSWQVVPSDLRKIMSDPATSPKAMSAILEMKKLDIAKIREAAEA